MALVGLFAGALADVVDRRRLLLTTQAWMMLAAAALALATFTGVVATACRRLHARRWIRSQAYGNGDTAEFIAVAERVSHQDLDAFFDLWLYTPERPPASAVTPADAGGAAAARSLDHVDRDAQGWVQRRQGLGGAHDH